MSDTISTIPVFIPSNWYWYVGDQSPTTQVWCSASASYVPLIDATFIAWCTYNTPTTIDTQANLAALLWQIYPAGAPLNNPVISSYAFMNRFTPAEQVTIATAAMSNAQVLLFMVRMGAATTIDLSNAIVETSVTTLETNGIIANGRSTVILTP